MSEYHECHGCGMMVASGAYHPYAACLMFRACLDGEVVRANLDGVMAHGIQYHSEEIPLRERITVLESEVERLRKTICFFRSVIQSGEDWSPVCERHYRAALQAEGGRQPSDQQGGEG